VVGWPLKLSRSFAVGNALQRPARFAALQFAIDFLSLAVCVLLQRKRQCVVPRPNPRQPFGNAFTNSSAVSSLEARSRLSSGSVAKKTSLPIVAILDLRL